MVRGGKWLSATFMAIAKNPQSMAVIHADNIPFVFDNILSPFSQKYIFFCNDRLFFLVAMISYKGFKNR